VSVETNRIEIEGEIERLAIGKWMLDAFYRHCKSRKEIKVDTSEISETICSPFLTLQQILLSQMHFLLLKLTVRLLPQECI
jgi:hypothetical protein